VFKRVTASVYYKFLQKISYSNVPRNVGDFKLYSRRAVNEIIAMREHDRLLRAQASWIGFNQTFVDFDRPAREVGETKYTLKKMIKLATDGIITNSNFPLTVSLWAGLGLGAVAVILAIVLALLPIWQIEVSLVAWLFPFILAMFAI
jgi:dolichol-phosphate mannosyltransferase